MNMLKEIKQAYVSSWRFALALPAIAAIPIVAEVIQHAVEWHVGMFESLQMAKQVENDPLRMGFGQVKIWALFAMGYWVPRFLGFSGDARRTTRFDATALALFAMVLVFSLMMMVAQTRGGEVLSDIVPAGRPLILVGLAGILAMMVPELFLAPWKAAAALGNVNLHLGASIRMMRGRIAWSFGFTMMMITPIMVLHYALNGFAIGLHPALSVALLAADSLLVGYMAILFPATAFIVADRAARLRGESLLPEAEVRPALA
jgi:hypothetical protein